VRPNFDAILIPPFTALIIGGKGSGKSVTGHRIAEDLHAKGHSIEILTTRRVVEKKILPEWMKKTSFQYPKYLADHVILYDETQLRRHARQFMGKGNIEEDKGEPLTRHRNQSLIHVTQNAFRLDRNLIASEDIIIFKKPKLIAIQYEKAEVQPLFENIYHNFKYHCPTPEDPRQSAFIIADDLDFYGWVAPIELPSYWSEDLSNWTKL